MVESFTLWQVKCDLMEVARQELPDLALAENVATLCRHKAAPGDLEHANPEHRKKRASNLAADTNQRRPFGKYLVTAQKLINL